MKTTFSRRSFLKGSAAAAAALGTPPLPARASGADDTENGLFSLLRMTQYGPVKGCTAPDGQLCWYGIPYGASSAGDARWTAPQEPARWLAVKDCTSPAPMAYQYSSCPLGTEDCLTLDIHAASGAKDRPVLVYLHSSFLTGSPEELPGLSEDAGCVFVGVSYRLGLFGWNCLPALTTGPDATGNFALLDIARALDWVKENIHAFGGDPDNITLCGFADGGRAAAALTGSEPFRGRFQRAIVLSGGLELTRPEDAIPRLAEAFAPLAVADGLFPDLASAAKWLISPDASVRTWLCGLEPSRIAALGADMDAFPCLFADGIVLPESGCIQSHVPLLLLSSATEFSAVVLHDLRPASEEAVAFAVKYGSALCRWSSTEAIAEALASGSSPVWLGLIDYGGADSRTPIPGLGSFHGIALALLSAQSSYASCIDLSSEGAQALAARLVRVVSDFTFSGDPGWQRWDADDRTTLRLDADSQHCYSDFTRYPDTRDSISAEMEADATLSAKEKQHILQLFFSGWYYKM